MGWRGEGGEKGSEERGGRLVAGGAPQAFQSETKDLGHLDGISDRGGGGGGAKGGHQGTGRRDDVAHGAFYQLSLTKSLVAFGGLAFLAAFCCFCQGSLEGREGGSGGGVPPAGAVGGLLVAEDDGLEEEGNGRGSVGWGDGS